MTEDPHTVLHLYEGDGGVIIRENGNVSTFGVQSDAVTAAFYAASDDTDETTTRDLLATIAGLRQQLERVTQERDDRQAALQKIADEHLPYVERVEAENARLRSALEPFARLAGAVFRVDEDGRMMNATKADEASIWGFDREEITYGGLRAALRAMQEKEG